VTDPSTPAQPKKRRRRRILAWILGSLGAVILVAVIGFLLWANIGVMAAEPDDLAAVRADPAITLTDAGGAWTMAPSDGESDSGLVFIPGAKVDPLAYAATLQGVVDEGVTVIITKPTLNLAFFDLRPLSDFTKLAPGIDEWSVGGHSLGGVKACQLAGDADGLVLFASYCANDLSDTDVPALSISGSEDALSTPQKIDDAAHLLPPDTIFVEIDGGNHAGFGAYGAQPGDGAATIPDAEIRRQITDALGPFLLETVPAP
jgi:pimeloyl-ACP methyl ester carboxylesterase